MSRPVVSPPYAPGGMMCEFAFKVPGSIHKFTIFFVYGQDEESLIITDVGYLDLIPGDETIEDTDD